jgi:hypothetical protein
MSPTDVTTRPTPVRRRAPLIALVVAGVLLAVALIKLVSAATATPEFVPRVTFVNGTPYGVDVDMRNADNDGRVLLGRALPEQNTTKHEVYDGGDQWIFEFTRGGVVAGEIEMSRSDLEHGGWRVTVPASVEQRLADAGQSPYPEEGSR